MPLTAKAAAESLSEIEVARARSGILHDYDRAAPHFLIWGILWLIGYALNDICPHQANAIWAVIVPLGFLAGLLATRDPQRGFAWRYAGALAAGAVFCLAALAILWPVSGRQIAAFIPLVVALLYVLKGFVGGLRYVGVGISVACLTLLRFFLLKQHFFLWMAAVGGGSLMLAGAWLRRV